MIDEIYKYPKPVEDKRSSGKASIYIKDIEILLLCELYKNKLDDGHAEIFITKKRLVKKLSMVNEVYQSDEATVSNLALLDGRITQYQLNTFYKRVNKNTGEIVERALKSLHRQKLINYKEQWVKIVDGKHIVIEEKYYDQILGYEREVLKEHGYKTAFNFIARNALDEYYAEVNEKVKKNLFPNITGIYRQYKISCMHNYLLDGIVDNLMDLSNLIDETRQDLNQKVINNINSDAKNNWKNYSDEDWFWFDPEYFYSVQSNLCKYLVDINITKDAFKKQVKSLSDELLKELPV